MGRRWEARVAGPRNRRPGWLWLLDATVGYWPVNLGLENGMTGIVLSAALLIGGVLFILLIAMRS